MLILLAAAALAPISDAKSAMSARCPDVVDYSNWKEAAGQDWDFRSDKLTVIGANHSRVPDDEQFARIAAEFSKVRPTVVFFEGPDRGVRSNAEETIRETGESGYVRWLASQAGVPARGLEPSPAEQFERLGEQYPADQIMLFFVLREATRLRDRENVTGAALEERIGQLMQKAGAMGLKLPVSDVAGLQAAFEHYWPGRSWIAADANWFSPTANDERTGGIFMAAINRADSSNRNRRLVHILAEAVSSGERPFVVIGRNHVPMIAPALDCLLP